MQGNLLILFLTFLIEIIFPLSFAADPYPSNLKKINHKIATIKAILSQDQNKRVIYFKKLKSAEIASNGIRFHF